MDLKYGEIMLTIGKEAFEGILETNGDTITVYNEIADKRKTNPKAVYDYLQKYIKYPLNGLSEEELLQYENLIKDKALEKSSTGFSDLIISLDTDEKINEFASTTELSFNVFEQKIYYLKRNLNNNYKKEMIDEISSKIKSILAKKEGKVYQKKIKKKN